MHILHELHFDEITNAIKLFNWTASRGQIDTHPPQDKQSLLST
jgi:hypothetical protein